MTHNPHCTGCPECTPEFAALMNMTPSQQAVWLRQDATRRAQAQGVRLMAAEIRTAVHATEDDTDDRLRRMDHFRLEVYGMVRRANLGFTPATGDVYENPPDPYQPQLDALRKATR